MVFGIYVAFLVITIMLMVVFVYYIWKGYSPFGILEKLKRPGSDFPEKCGKCVLAWWFTIFMLIVVGFAMSSPVLD